MILIRTSLYALFTVACRGYKAWLKANRSAGILDMSVCYISYTLYIFYMSFWETAQKKKIEVHPNTSQVCHMQYGWANENQTLAKASWV